MVTDYCITTGFAYLFIFMSSYVCMLTVSLLFKIKEVKSTKSVNWLVVHKDF